MTITEAIALLRKRGSHGEGDNIYEWHWNPDVWDAMVNVIEAAATIPILDDTFYEASIDKAFASLARAVGGVG